VILIVVWPQTPLSPVPYWPYWPRASQVTFLYAHTYMTVNLDDVRARAARRRQALDPLLPPARRAGSSPAAGPAGTVQCGAPLVVSRNGRPIAVGSCEHWAGQPGSLELSWGAARRYQLTASVADAGVAEALDELLSRWRDHLAGLPGSADEDTAAVVDWPSRDVDGIAALLRHGLAPLEVLAVRSTPPRTGRSPSASVTPNGHAPRRAPRIDSRIDSRIGIRRAGPADAETVARLGLELIRFDTRFGTINERPDTLDALRREAIALLAGPEPWTWLAERDGEATGLLAAQRPEAAGWITRMAAPLPAAYLSLTFVQPGQRSGGVGAALADEFHAAIDAADLQLTLLHHEQLNPLSAPFWHRQGYRPLWTTWQATPARAIRLPTDRRDRRRPPPTTTASHHHRLPPPPPPTTTANHLPPPPPTSASAVGRDVIFHDHLRHLAIGRHSATALLYARTQ